MKVETQGSAGSTPLGAAEIAAADAVIFAHDLPVKDAGRFAGKPIVDVGVKKAHLRRPGPRRGGRADRRAVAGPPAAGRRGHGGRTRRSSGGLTTKVDSDASTLHQAAPVADDRCLLHDPVRRRGRHPHRHLLHARPGRDGRAGRDRDREVRPDRRGRLQHHPELRPAEPDLVGRRCSSSWAGRRSGSSCRSSPASSRSRSPTGPASCPASSAASSPRRWAPASSAASSPASSAASPPAGSPAGRCTRACAASCRSSSSRCSRPSSPPACSSPCSAARSSP